MGPPAATWLLTEAYWAGTVRAPAFSQTLRYLQRHIGSIIDGITAGYGPREERRKDRNEELAANPGEPITDRVRAEVRELRTSDSWHWSWIERIDRIWSRRWIRWLLSQTARLATIVTLAIYAPLRAVPIKAIRDRAELAALDAQLVDAFGDLPVLLDDAVQAALIRQRLAATIDWIRERGCDDVVLVAHSGG